MAADDFDEVGIVGSAASYAGNWYLPERLAWLPARRALPV